MLARGVRLVRRVHHTAPVAVSPHPAVASAAPLTTAPTTPVTGTPVISHVPGARQRPTIRPASTRPVGATAVPGPAERAETVLLTGDRTLARRLSFALANGCTIASLVLGVLAILLAMHGQVQYAALCVMACVAFDGLDGAVARRLGVSTPFGAQMDSLADMCSFGIAAPVVVYAWLAGSVPTAAAVAACALVAACSAIRLARFNVSPRDGRFFTGVPTTMAAGVLALLVLIDLPVSAKAQLLGVTLLAFAMVSSFPYATVARLVRLPVWLWLVPLAGLMVNPQLTLAVLIAAYLASGPLLWLHRRRAAA